MSRENQLTEKIIRCAIEVHRELGPGLLESVYEECLCHQLKLAGLSFVRQERVPIRYKGILLATTLRLDLWIECKVIVDAKAKTDVSPVDKQQPLPYLRLCKVHLGLIINFNQLRLVDGITRIVNKLPNQE